MRVNQIRLRDWNEPLLRDGEVGCVLVFGPRHLLEEEEEAYAALRTAYPHAHIAGCSTAGEIGATTVSDDELVITAVRFSRSSVHCATQVIECSAHSRECGSSLATALRENDLVHVLVLSDGLRVNGSELIEGLRLGLDGTPVTVSGGLAADGAHFGSTVVMGNAPARSGLIVALGFYGSGLRVGCGSLGGWDTFGPDRCITRSRDNVVYEFDGQPALDLYKHYLGSLAARLPCSGLLFPLALELQHSQERVVRTILAIDCDERSLTFAGDMPQGTHAQLMHANFNRLIFGAIGAAHKTRAALGEHPVQFAILISCVGRKLVLHQRVEEEIEGVREVLGNEAVLAGFYAYGEMAPHGGNGPCELHNQTMTVTAFCELD